jgi:gas vesicle protein
MMKKIVTLVALVLLASNANAWDLASVANKVKSVADETSAKIESVQNKSDEKSQEAQNSIMEKINELKDKIAKWQASDNAESSEIQKAIADAKASIEKLMAQLKALQGN